MKCVNLGISVHSTMALDDPVVLLLIIALIAVPVYLLSLLVKFLWKANRFMDEYDRKKKESERQEAAQQ